jgi:Glucose / Sorbosone dehydrogenase
MATGFIRALFVVLLVTVPAFAQTANDPFPRSIPPSEGVIRVNVVEFASIPDVNGEPARMMLMSHEPGTRRLFVNDMRGPLYTVSEDGKSVGLYLDINASQWGVRVQSMGNERGFQSFAFHPQFDQAGARGFGRFYTYTDSANMTPAPDFTPGGGNNTHDTVLLEWTAQTPSAATYDGGPPRELIRIRQPFANHNAGLIAFNPNAATGSADFGLLYMTIADGGSGGDPLDLAQNLGSAFGKFFRIDPLGTNSTNGKYGIPPSNPFVGKANARALGEIYAYGFRNPQRFGWDPRNGNLFVADIGQNIVEEVSLVTGGANLGWNDWEGSYRYISRAEVALDKPRADPSVTFPVVEYDHNDPVLLRGDSAVTGIVVYRSSSVPQLANLVLFGDNPSGQVFYFSADNVPRGGPEMIRRVLFNHNGAAITLLELIKEKNAGQRRSPAPRADLRFGTGPNGQVFLLNKRDGVVRLLTR